MAAHTFTVTGFSDNVAMAYDVRTNYFADETAVCIPFPKTGQADSTVLARHQRTFADGEGG